MTAVRTPTALGSKARRLWSEVVAGFDLRPDELRLLEDACREVDVVERIEKALRDTNSLLIPGSKGQLRPNPLLAELRGHRLVLARLLHQVGIPDEEPAAPALDARERSSSARRAANARWQ